MNPLVVALSAALLPLGDLGEADAADVCGSNVVLAAVRVGGHVVVLGPRCVTGLADDGAKAWTYPIPDGAFALRLDLADTGKVALITRRSRRPATLGDLTLLDAQTGAFIRRHPTDNGYYCGLRFGYVTNAGEYRPYRGVASSGRWSNEERILVCAINTLVTTVGKEVRVYAAGEQQLRLVEQFPIERPLTVVPGFSPGRFCLAKARHEARDQIECIDAATATKTMAETDDLRRRFEAGLRPPIGQRAYPHDWTERCSGACILATADDRPDVRDPHLFLSCGDGVAFQAWVTSKEARVWPGRYAAGDELIAASDEPYTLDRIEILGVERTISSYDCSGRLRWRWPARRLPGRHEPRLEAE